MITPAHQALEFFLCFSAGGLVSALYIAVRFLFLQLYPKKWLEFILDFILATASALLLFFVVEKVNYGKVLYYHYLGFLTGFGVFRSLLLKFVYPFSRQIIKKAEALYKWIQKLPLLKNLFK